MPDTFYRAMEHRCSPLGQLNTLHVIGHYGSNVIVLANNVADN